MNLICQLRAFFFCEEPSVSSYDRLLADLNRACSHLPEGQAFLVTGDGEFTVRLTWKPRQTPPDKRMFSLNGQDEVTEWIEAVPTATKEPKPVDIAQACRYRKRRKGTEAKADDATPLTLLETALCFPLQYADGADGMCSFGYGESR